MLFQIAVLHYFNSFDKKLPVTVYIFCKATASAALQKLHTFTGDIWIIWGMIRRTANLRNIYGELLLTNRRNSQTHRQSIGMKAHLEGV